MNMIGLSHLTEHNTALLSCCTAMITFKSLQMARLSLHCERLKDICAEPPLCQILDQICNLKLKMALKVLISAYYVITTNQPVNATFSLSL